MNDKKFKEKLEKYLPKILETSLKKGQIRIDKNETFKTFKQYLGSFR